MVSVSCGGGVWVTGHTCTYSTAESFFCWASVVSWECLMALTPPHISVVRQLVVRERKVRGERKG